MTCSFCSVNGSFLGVHDFLKNRDSDTKQLKDILENVDKKTGLRVMSQNDQILQDMFNLGDGSSKQSFNYLVKQKLARARYSNEDCSDLSK